LCFDDFAFRRENAGASEMTQEELNEILKKHEMWLEEKEGGERAKLAWVTLKDADLVKANLRGANLSGAYLTEAGLDRADLSEAMLRWANLTGAKLRGADLVGATYDSKTEFPEGFNPEQHGMRKVDHE
jgi:uncharacterized protein YjbI with pentapeptide repeats